MILESVLWGMTGMKATPIFVNQILDSWYSYKMSDGEEWSYLQFTVKLDELHNFVGHLLNHLLDSGFYFVTFRELAVIISLIY